MSRPPSPPPTATVDVRSDAVVLAANLTYRYGRHEAVRDVSFAIAPGSIFALVGPNGAGKTTTIRMLMNILPPSSGRALVLGTDSRRLGPGELTRIGYVSETQELPLWMTVAEFLEYCRPLYPTWDDAFCRALVEDFDLPLGVRIRRLSRGMRVKAALVSALAYRPQLLVLDEPFSGLDPVVRDDLVHGVLQRAGAERWSVLVSSHDLDELERLIDIVAFIDAGRIVLAERLASLHGRCRRIHVTLPGAEQPPHLDSRPLAWIAVATEAGAVRFVDTAYVAGESERQIQTFMPRGQIAVYPMTLREIFIALLRERRRTQGAAA